MPDADQIKIKLVLILTVGFGYASVLGYLAHRIKLSPIVGYLFAGYLIGPFSPGFIADLHLAEQMAEIGVILMMFGVGLHFKWQQLWKTSRLAVPGAISQMLICTIIGAVLIYSIGGSIETGVIFGLAIAVASTVVLVHVLRENNLLKTTDGHICVGWLVVEDIITVFALLLIPAIAATSGGNTFPIFDIVTNFGASIVKFSILVLIMFTIGNKVFSYIFEKVQLTHSHELFTLTFLAVTFAIAAGAFELFGTSMVLGAFLAGMVMGQTVVHRKVAANALPLQDAFLVIFFLSIGMLFNPSAIPNHFILFVSALFLILIIKPLLAMLISLLFRYPLKTALTIAVSLAQIGEFSFILAEEALKLNLIPDEAFDIIVACSLISISVNPLLFKLIASRKTGDIV